MSFSSLQPTQKKSVDLSEKKGAGSYARESNFSDQRAIAQRREQLKKGAESFRPSIAATQLKDHDGGLPNSLKSGIEQLSGQSMDDVKVHSNSSKPAEVQAHAYAQGNEIHIAPGQDQHLPHEAWHVAQQKQGRVKPTTEVNGVPVNDSPSLEREADVMGAKAMNG